jgi:hypothetical protein
LRQATIAHKVNDTFNVADVEDMGETIITHTREGIVDDVVVHVKFHSSIVRKNVAHFEVK